MLISLRVASGDSRWIASAATAEATAGAEAKGGEEGGGDGGGNDSAMNWGADSAIAVDAADVTGFAPRPRRHWCTRLSFNLKDSATAATNAPGSGQAARTCALNSAL